MLGDLAPKALNTPSKQSYALDAPEVMRAQSPLKQVTTLSPQIRIDKENMNSMSAFAQGRKRSIYEVDDAENVEMPKAIFGARDQLELGPRADLTAAAMQSYAVVPSLVRRVGHVANMFPGNDKRRPPPSRVAHRAQHTQS